jgi:1-acyl-sn-glycerol-3-phosphate acyltransferase
VATHQSPYDIPLLIRHIPRLLDFVSSADLFRNPIVASLYRLLNAFPLDRTRSDPTTVRTIVKRLQQGRVVAMFPEGGIRAGEDSVVNSHRIKAGVGRIARLSGAPVVPCVIVDSAAYSRPRRWLPIKRTRYGIIAGPPIVPHLTAEKIESMIIDSFVSLHRTLCEEMGGRPCDKQWHQQDNCSEPSSHHTNGRDDAE